MKSHPQRPPARPSRSATLSSLVLLVLHVLAAAAPAQDVRVALDFARPLVLGAAVALHGDHGPSVCRSVSAAKLAAGDAAYLAARVGLQLHGAIGYTAEFDLGLWILRVRALVGAWGDAAHHRARIAETLLTEVPG